MSNKLKSLIIDDEVQIRRLLKIRFEAEGFHVVEAGGGREGLQHAAAYLPDFIILDLGLPDFSGIEVLKELRKWSSVPVIILSVQNDDMEKVLALESGADDYVCKPFSLNELLARIKVALRHQKGPSQVSKKIQVGNLELDLDAHLVLKNGKELRLSSIEFSLLSLFVINADKVLTHKYILREIWGPKNEADTHYLRIYIASLRKKIEENSSEPKLLTTEPGVGYRLRSAELIKND